MCKTICKECNKEFNASRKQVNWCSALCRQRWRTKNKQSLQVEKECPVCKTVFIGTPRSKFCSRDCYLKWPSLEDSKQKEYSNNWYRKTKDNPLNIKKYLLKHAKARAVKRNLPFTLTLEDITLPTHCIYLGIELQQGHRKYAFSIDRIIPELGYTKDNIQIISTLANSMKWNSTKEERLAFAKSILALEGG